MSRSLNKAIIIGNVGADPEVRSISSGSRVANFSVATNRQWTDRSGQKQEKTEWHRIVVWETQYNSGMFKAVEEYMKKGEKVFVEGEIQYRQYEDKDGVTKYSTEINARELILLGGRDGAARSPAPASDASEYEDFKAPVPGDGDDDLPF